MHCGTAVGEARAAEESLEETEYEEACEVFDQSGWDGEDDEDQHCDGIDGTSTDYGDFAEGRKNQWAHAVGEDVEGEREGSIGWRDTEFLDDAGFAGRVDCGAAVDGESVGANE